MALLEFDSSKIVAQLASSRAVLVQDVSFSVDAGKSLALIGETGSGKTIAALAIMGLLPSNVSMDAGRIVFDGRDLLALSRSEMRGLLGDSIVYIPQCGGEFLSPSRKVGAHFADSLKRLGVPRSRRREVALDRLAVVGFEHPAQIVDRYPFQLSGGMAQRVAIALAACADARLVIADEPTNGLDRETTRAFGTLLDAAFPRAARLVITHDVAVAALCDETLVMCKGRMMERGPSACVLDLPRHPYTRALIGSLVRNGMHETPVLRRGEAACPFYGRCPDVGDACLSRRAHRADDGVEWWCNADHVADLRTA